MNDTIQVFYTVSFPDGTEFQSNANGTPLEFTVGSGDVIAGFDEAVIGMTPGMVKTVTLSPEKGYGPYQQQLVNNMDTSQVIAYAEKLKAEGNFEVIQYPAIGPVAIWKKPDGTIGYIRFTNITNATTTVDENHPLAGKDLIFEITLVQIVNSTA